MSLREINEALTGVTGRDIPVAKNLEGLVGDVRDSFQAIEEKGGTVPESLNTESLPSSIETIIGGEQPAPEWGRLYFYTEETNVPQCPYVSATQNATVRILSIERFKAFVAEYPSTQPGTYTFEFSSGFQTTIRYTNCAGGIRTIGNMYAFGLGATASAVSGASFSIGTYANYPMYVGAPIGYVTLSSQQEVNSLCSDAEEYVVGNLKIPAYSIVKFVGGTELTSIGDKFLSKSGVKEVDFSNSNKLTSVGNYFLAYCVNLNSGVELPKATTVGTYFLYYSSVCGRVSLPEITETGSYFCAECFDFNHELNIPKVENIGNNFLSGARSFNRPVDLSNIETIGTYFLQGSNAAITGNLPNNPSMAFNQPVDFSGVQSLGNYTLANNRNLNSTITLPTSGTIGSNFLDSCYSFNKDIYISSTITKIGQGFLKNCNNMLAITYCNAPATVLTTSPLSDTSSFSDGSNNTARYMQGAKLSGVYAANWHTALPDVSSSGSYRKIIEV